MGWLEIKVAREGFCAVELSVELSGCHSVGIVEFLFDILHDASDSVGNHNEYTPQ